MEAVKIERISSYSTPLWNLPDCHIIYIHGKEVGKIIESVAVDRHSPLRFRISFNILNKDNLLKRIKVPARFIDLDSTKAYIINNFNLICSKMELKKETIEAQLKIGHKSPIKEVRKEVNSRKIKALERSITIWADRLEAKAICLSTCINEDSRILIFKDIKNITAKLQTQQRLLNEKQI